MNFVHRLADNHAIMSMSHNRLAGSRRVVVKIGSALLVDRATAGVHRTWLEALADDVARLCARNQQPIIVSSGAVALGAAAINGGARPVRLEQKQAAAAIGQISLTRAYQEVLGARDIRVAQVLVTLGDTEDRLRHLNARETLETLLKWRVVPVINENDTVATEEIRYGDNDRLAARVAQMISADCLVLLSDIDGLYTEDPAQNPGAELIEEVHEITPQIMAMAGTARGEFGSGGMHTKLSAARVAMGAGCAMVITNGRTLSPLTALEQGARCTWFLPGNTPQAARKRWIAGNLRICGVITVDAGAERALAKGGSLLAVGVMRMQGAFQRGDALSIVSEDQRELARGLSAYSSEEALRIIGRKSGEIEAILGVAARDAMVHRDDLVWLGRNTA